MEDVFAARDLPQTEPARQYYFIDAAKTIVGEKERQLGRKLNYCIHTFGCQMNARDSEKLAGILRQAGYVQSTEKEADLILFNTCTVRENANNKVYGRLGALSHYKKQNDAMVILCGCMMQEKHVVETILEKYPFVDLIFGTHNIYKFAELLVRAMQSEQTVVDIREDEGEPVEDLPVSRKYPFKSGVNIMYGCNNFCSYCIVPYVRGRERSRKPEDILQEIRRLTEDGVVEVMLLGQNVNSYGKTLEEPMSFARLLEQVEQIPHLERIRFMTSHPKDLSDELIDVLSRSKKICPHLHLPLQSGSSAVLKAMNRRYTKEEYLRLVDKIRTKIPDIALTTDIIVGFPGETEEDFMETMDVVERVRFDGAFTFLYSKRTGTPAAARQDQVPEDVAKERFDRLLALVQKISGEKAAQAEGSVATALVEEINAQEEGYVTGRLDNNAIVHFPGGASLIGTLVKVRLKECKGFYYMGEQV